MTTKYANDLSELDPGSSHARMVRLVGRERDVLETGCAQGYMTKLLADQGCDVVGLEIDADAAEEARAFAREVVVTDLEGLDFAGRFGVDRFDVIVYGDVLEHLSDPLGVLRASLGCLRADGRVVVSIPNVAHGAVRLSLLEGRFDYTPLGLLDDTHLRFFTADTLAELLTAAGLVVDRLERVEMPVLGTEIPIDPAGLPAGVADHVAASPEATTYQFVLSAARSDLPPGELGKLNRAAFGRPAERALQPHQNLSGMLADREREIAAMAAYQEELADRLSRQRSEAIAYQARLEAEVEGLRAYVEELSARLSLPRPDEQAYSAWLEARVRELEAGGGHGRLGGLSRRVNRLRGRAS